MNSTPAIIERTASNIKNILIPKGKKLNPYKGK